MYWIRVILFPLHVCVCVCLCEKERETYPLDWLHVHCGHSHIFPALRCCRPLWPQTPHWLLRWHTQRLPHGCLTHTYTNTDTHSHIVSLCNWKDLLILNGKTTVCIKIKSVLKSKGRSLVINMQELVKPINIERSWKMSQYFKMVWNNPHHISFGNSFEVISNIFKRKQVEKLTDLLVLVSALLLCVISVPRLCADACRELLTGIAAVYNLTLGDHFAKHRHGLQSGAVPSTVAKLELTLVYSQLGSTTHRIHHLHTALTDLNLEHRNPKSYISH